MVFETGATEPACLGRWPSGQQHAKKPLARDRKFESPHAEYKTQWAQRCLIEPMAQFHRARTRRTVGVLKEPVQPKRMSHPPNALLDSHFATVAIPHVSMEGNLIVQILIQTMTAFESCPPVMRSPGLGRSPQPSASSRTNRCSKAIAARRRQGIELRTPVGVGNLPLARKQFGEFKSVTRRVKQSFLYPEDIDERRSIQRRWNTRAAISPGGSSGSTCRASPG